MRKVASARSTLVAKPRLTPAAAQEDSLLKRFTGTTDTRGKGEKLTRKSVVALWILCLVALVLRGRVLHRV